MKKYICIITLTLANTAWSMDHKKHSFKAVNPNDLKTTLHSFQTDADIKEGWKIIDTINEKTGIISPKISQNTTTLSHSPLFVVHDKYPDKFSSKL